MSSPCYLQVSCSFSSLITTVLLAVLLYNFAITVYRLYLSPISKFPGPKFAAATFAYEAYYNILKGGKYTFKIKELHERYGPIVWINPWELHVNGPHYHEEIFSLRSPRNKTRYSADQFGLSNSSASTVDHTLLRIRQQPVNQFFFKQAIRRLDRILSSLVEKLCGRIDEYKGTGESMNMKYAYQCFTTDVVSYYVFGKTWGFLEHPDFNPVWCKTVQALSDFGNVVQQLPWSPWVFQALPEWMVACISPNMILIFDWQTLRVQRSTTKYNEVRRSTTKYIQEIITSRNINNPETKDKQSPTIIHALLDSNLPPAEKSLQRLSHEVQLIVGAGADTTANALVTITFHILDNPPVMETLVAELEQAMSNPRHPADLTILEQLPHLSAVVLEGLRLSYGLAQRLTCTAPTEVLKYQGWSIPSNTPISMTSTHIHHDESIFPDSNSFLPRRWLSGDKALERYLVNFSKGSRQCVGINLAKAELYLVIATLVHRYKMELFDMIRERDVNMCYELFLSCPRGEGRDVRVVFR
ncbi:cytochrome P450 [Halenospora varia]|nr:cytochrome P450 [Halenospora varia]